MNTEMLLIALAALLFALAAALLVVLLVRQGRNAGRSAEDWERLQNELLNEMDAQRDQTLASLRATGDTMMQHMNGMAANQAVMLDGMRREMADLRRDNEAQLTRMRHTVDERLEETLEKRLDSSFAQVSARLEEVYRSMGEMQSLAAGVGDLKKVLTNVKTRGIWGEMQLGNLLEQMLSPEQYGANVTIVPGSREQVEYAIRLPGRDGETVWLPIDAKFPQEDYIRLAEASEAADAPAVEAARKALAARVKTEAKRIHDKYICPPYSTDFAVMFLPVEGLYAEVMRDSALTQELQRQYRVTVAGPSTLTALLSSLQMGFRTLAIEKRTSEVWQLLGGVKRDFGAFGEALAKAQTQLQQAGTTLDTAFSRTKAIQRRLDSMEKLGDGSEG